jgi:hypothetical protein
MPGKAKMGLPVCPRLILAIMLIIMVNRPPKVMAWSQGSVVSSIRLSDISR